MCFFIVQLTEASLLQDLDHLDKLAPEATSYTSNLRKTSSDLVASALGSAENSDVYLGSVDGESILSSVYDSVDILGNNMLHHFQQLSEELQVVA